MYFLCYSDGAFSFRSKQEDALNNLKIITMQRRKGISTLFFLSFFGLSTVQAQEAIPASGGNASGTGGSVSYTVGQVVYSTNTGTSGTVAQGVQQPYEISVVTGNQDIRGITLSCLVYPNPATDFVILNIQDLDNQNLVYLLYDINGKILETKEVRNNETTIHMGILVAGTYFLKIVETIHASSQEVRTFKIIKK